MIATQDYDTKLANRDQAKATVLANQSALETAKLNLEFAEVRSPIDGRTSTYNYSVGNLVQPALADHFLEIQQCLLINIEVNVDWIHGDH